MFLDHFFQGISAFIPMPLLQMNGAPCSQRNPKKLSGLMGAVHKHWCYLLAGMNMAGTRGIFFSVVVVVVVLDDGWFWWDTAWWDMVWWDTVW